MGAVSNPGRLRDFVGALADLVDRAAGDEPRILHGGARLLGELVAHDDWLSPTYAVPGTPHYRQYLLHCDSRQRFSVVSFVWGPGQATPVHDHTVWGLVGVLRGEELSQGFRLVDGAIAPSGPEVRLRAGEVTAVSPSIGDIHRVANALADRPSISIHVYGGNIGAIRRSTFDGRGARKPFVSSYANATLPNLWNAPEELRP